MEYWGEGEEVREIEMGLSCGCSGGRSVVG